MLYIHITDSLQRFSVQITQRVEPSLILPHLLGKGLVTAVQVENLSDKNQISSAKKEYLLCNVLIRLSEKNVNKFVECLKETSNYDPHNELLRIINNGIYLYIYVCAKLILKLNYG